MAVALREACTSILECCEYIQILTIDRGNTYCPIIFLTNLRIHESDRSMSTTSLPTIVLSLFMTLLVWFARLLSSATGITILSISGSSSGFGLRSSSLDPSWDVWWTSSGVSILISWLGSSAALTVLCLCCVSVSIHLCFFDYYLLFPTSAWSKRFLHS